MTRNVLLSMSVYTWLLRQSAGIYVNLTPIALMQCQKPDKCTIGRRMWSLFTSFSPSLILASSANLIQFERNGEIDWDNLKQTISGTAFFEFFYSGPEWTIMHAVQTSYAVDGKTFAPEEWGVCVCAKTMAILAHVGGSRMAPKRTENKDFRTSLWSSQHAWTPTLQQTIGAGSWSLLTIPMDCWPGFSFFYLCKFKKDLV